MADKNNNLLMLALHGFSALTVFPENPAASLAESELTLPL